jgi:colanic acid biosynthesis glycosyl transferase WcaI
VRVLVIGINYAPERTGVAPFTTGLCEHLSRAGHDVNVVTAFPYYPEWRVWDGYRGLFYRQEALNGVTVHRIAHYVPSKPSRLLERLAYDFSFTFTSFLVALFTGKCDAIYCSCPPPTVALAGYVLGKIKRAPYVIKLTDLASDAALATGILKEGWVVRVARAIEGFVYRKASAIVCLCQGFADKLISRGVDSGKLHLIADWGDTESIRPVEADCVFRQANGFSPSQCIVLHSGNMGKKQNLTNVVKAAELAQEIPDLLWLLVGGGEDRAAIEREIAERRLANIRLLPFQPAKTLPDMYSSADMVLLNQTATLEGAVIPSKLLTYMAAGRPVVAAVSEKSEAARLIRDADCGVIAAAEDPASLVAAVLSLRADCELRKRLGANGRAYAEEHFTKAKVLQAYDEFFQKVLAVPKAYLLAPQKFADDARDVHPVN